MGTDHSKPLVDLPAKESVFWMNPASELIPETASRKQGDANLPCLEHPTFPSNPHVEVEDTGRVGQRDHHLALHGHAMAVDFAIECFAEGDLVRVVAVVISEPGVKLIKKVKTSPIDHTIAAGLVFGTEENRRSKNPLKALRAPAVISTIFRESEEVEHLGSTAETYRAAFLTKGKRSNPNRNEAILAERKAIIRDVRRGEGKSFRSAVCRRAGPWKQDGAEFRKVQMA